MIYLYNKTVPILAKYKKKIFWYKQVLYTTKIKKLKPDYSQNKVKSTYNFDDSKQVFFSIFQICFFLANPFFPTNGR